MLLLLAAMVMNVVAVGVGLLVVLVSVLLLKHASKKKLNLPPSPKGRMPIIGHLHMMDDNEAAHRTFARISEQNGQLTMIYMAVGRLF